MKRKLNLILVSLCFLMAGCATVPKRNPLPPELAFKAEIPGLKEARVYADEPLPYADEWFAQSREELKKKYPTLFGKDHHYLALSGGGSNGAFGAGLLAGWHEAGTRPEFSMVTGISTGALIAPFAFLGPEYDQRLREMYTKYTTKDLIKKRYLITALFSDATAETGPFQDLIKEYYNEEIVEAIGQEYLTKGRVLNIATTNLDTGKSVIWEVAFIAASDLPNKVELIQKIILASASIPVAFEPVLFQVEAEGKMYDELHVDGGATTQVFLYPTTIDWDRVLKKLEVKTKPKVYVILNGSLKKDPEIVQNKLLPIAGKSIDSLIRTQAIGDLYRIYIETKRDGLDFHMTNIPESFEERPKELFDTEYMSKLYMFAYNMAKDGNPWRDVPPGFETD